LTITTFQSDGTQIDISAGSFTLTPTAAALALTLTSATSTVGATENLLFTLNLVNTLPANGKIHIFLQKWNTDSPTPESVFTGNASCTSVTGVSGTFCNTIKNHEGSTNDKILVTALFTTTATTIEFSIINFRNPPSFEPWSIIRVYTSAATETNILDEVESVSLTMLNAAILPAANIAITAVSSEINVETSYNFAITVTNPIPSGGRIVIGFPTEITVNSISPIGLGSGKIATQFTTSWDSTLRNLTLTQIITEQSNYVNVGDTISFQIQSITNPSSTAATSSFVFYTINSVDYFIEYTIASVTFTATPGKILTYLVVPTVQTIIQRTSYKFTFTTTNIILAGSSIKITFPTEIVPDARTGTSCVTSATVISAATSTCTVANTHELTISGGFASDVTAGDSIIFSIDSINNADTTAASSFFQAEFAESGGNIIDSYQGTDITVSVSAREFTSFTQVPSSDLTGVVTTYTFTLSIPTAVLAGSYVQVNIPNVIAISSLTTAASTCAISSGFASAITCALTEDTTANAYILRVTGGFASATTSNTDVAWTITGLRNPRSTTPTLSFKAYINDASDNGQYIVESGERLSITTPSDFAGVAFSRDSTVNGVSSTYQFTITLSNQIFTGDFIRVIFPTEVSVRSSSSQ
jgi:hypothetical protein